MSNSISGQVSGHDVRILDRIGGSGRFMSAYPDTIYPKQGGEAAIIDLLAKAKGSGLISESKSADQRG